MPLLINLRELAEGNLVLEGQCTPEELELESLDELIQVSNPLSYKLRAEKLDNAVLVQGQLEIVLDCECARCLNPFRHKVLIDNWVCHLPLSGEDKPVIVKECLDLTPYLREDILLALPQHPLCKPDCGGLISPQQAPETEPGGMTQSSVTPSAWAELNKLKFDD